MLHFRASVFLLCSFSNSQVKSFLFINKHKTGEQSNLFTEDYREKEKRKSKTSAHVSKPISYSKHVWQ